MKNNLFGSRNEIKGNENWIDGSKNNVLGDNNVIIGDLEGFDFNWYLTIYYFFLFFLIIDLFNLIYHHINKVSVDLDIEYLLR